MKMRYPEGTRVVIHSLGPSHEGKEYRAVIRGISIDGPAARIYIVEMIDKIEPLNWVYSHCTMPEACLKIGTWCEQCGLKDGECEAVITKHPCGHSICQHCCCPNQLPFTPGHICHCDPNPYENYDDLS